MKKTWIIMLLVILFSGCSKATDENAEKLAKEMVLVPAGTFLMGTNEDIDGDNFYEFGFNKPFFADAAPSHEIHLDAYYIDKYEVSNEQYFEFIRAANHKAPVHWEERTFAQGSEKFPIIRVSWYDASEYCKWAGKRLPTEAEWEKAAKGEDNRRYPWGNEFDYSKANLSQNPEFRGDIRKVDSYETGKSPYGAYNMVGNVWEWTDSWYTSYPDSAYETPKFGEKFKVARGNSASPVAHFEDEKYVEIVEKFSSTFFRFPVPPAVAPNDTGFRCAKSGP
jgi:formylglycine-generating enzyme required for sulfatase activity